MLKESLVYIRKPGGGDNFVGCGAFIEQNLIATCRHVWRDAGEQGEAVFPHVRHEGGIVTSPLILIDACKGTVGVDPDLVLLRATNLPAGLTPLQVARGQDYECGNAKALARLPGRNTDRVIHGVIDRYVDAKGRGSFSQDVTTIYWFEKGSSGSPLFVDPGQQLAGLISMAELGDEPQNAPIREAYVVPGTAIWPFVQAVAEREFDERQRDIRADLEHLAGAHKAQEFILEIVRRSGGDAAATPEQALANARAAFEEGQKAIEAGTRGGNLGDLVDDLLKKIAERTRLGDFAGGAAEADRAFAEWERIEVERREELIAAGTRILSEGVRQDMLRRDFPAAAERAARIVDLEQPNPADRFSALREKQDVYYVEGRDRGNNALLEMAIALARIEVNAARDEDERGAAQVDLGVALWGLGERQSGTERLEEAVLVYREALKEYTSERVPLDWAMTQNNLGIALRTLGARESGTGRLEEAVTAYREALKECTRERVSLDWAMTQNNLGNALWSLGERESGMERLDEAVTAYREALKERTRERVPLQWAMTQNNLGNALSTMGERESGTERLEEAVIAYREALKEQTRERVPLNWAMTQNNLGTALSSLGEREGGLERLEEAVTAFRESLKERTRERVPLSWAGTQNNLGAALRTLGERESGTERLEEAVTAYREALTIFANSPATRYCELTEQNLRRAERVLQERRGQSGV